MRAILFHVGLGVLAAINRDLMMPVLIATLIYFTYRIVTGKDKQQQVLLACAYIAGAEVFFRMSKAYLFWETGKYAIIFYCLLGMTYLGFKRDAAPYLLYFLFLLPAIAVSYNQLTFDVDFRKSVLFNLSGPFCLSVAAVFSFGRRVTQKQLMEILNYLVYPIIAMVVYIVLYSPDVQEAITNTASNANFSGGYSGNQVATVLGLGAFIILTRFFIPYKNALVQGVMMFFMALMAYRALLTFSRGGVLVAVIMAIVFMGIYYLSGLVRGSIKPSFKLLTLVFAGLALWGYTHIQTRGLIENRYTNKDALGREKGDFTTGRTKLLEAEFDAFKESPFMGIGAGRVKVYFEEELDIHLPTHNEVTRTLAEHGALGILALITLIFAPIITMLQGRRNLFFWPFLIFWFLTIAHSSMRVALPAFVYALCLLNVNYESENETALRRKSIAEPRSVADKRRHAPSGT